MLNFLKSGQSCNYSLAVHNTESRPNPDAIRIGEIIVSKGKKFDQSMTLNIIPSEIEGPQSYDLSGSNLFCMLSPAIDPQMRSRHQREVILISGPSGSGKSTYCSQVCRAWERTIRQKIIMFSAIDNDPAFDDIKMKRIPFDKLVDENGEPNDCIQIEDLKDSLVLFDDVDVISNKSLRNWVQELRNRCLETGRHYNISMIATNHTMQNYQQTKILNMEATKIVLFPSSSGAAQIKRYLKSYLGLSPQEIKDIFALKSRWVMINKTAPRFVMSASEAYIL